VGPSFLNYNYIKKFDHVEMASPAFVLGRELMNPGRPGNSMKPVLKEVPTFWDYPSSSLGMW
jgi:hypothetical protein